MPGEVVAILANYIFNFTHRFLMEHLTLYFVCISLIVLVLMSISAFNKCFIPVVIAFFWLNLSLYRCVVHIMAVTHTQAHTVSRSDGFGLAVSAWGGTGATWDQSLAETILLKVYLV
jgi:hypothetical protein